MSIEDFVLLRCNGKGSSKCDWCCTYYLEGLDLSKFKCPICNSNSCSVKTFEKVRSLWELNLFCSIRSFLNFLNRKLNPIFIKRKEEWVKKHTKELEEWTKKESEKRLTNDLLNGKITMEEYKEIKKNG